MLVVDVLPSPAQLHMVTGYGENRYYRRLPGTAIPMTEPEVRDAYARVLTARTNLEGRERELLAPEEQRRALAAESIFVVPLHQGSSLVNPGELDGLRKDVEEVLRFEREIAQEVTFALKTEADGCRAQIPASGLAYIYFAVLKTGLVHWSFDGAFASRSSDKDTLNLLTDRVLIRVVEALELARRVHDRAGYRGPVRVHYVLRASGAFTIDRNPYGINFRPKTVPAGIYRTGPAEAYLGQRGYSRVAKELLDPIFHSIGVAGAPWFDAAGVARSDRIKEFPKEITSLLN